ncbi:MAG: flippase-like domain-containing protein [Acidobacteria bacterium]|nr:flippase-like domain-containing protein [Acidobacteriota bacterium]
MTPDSRQRLWSRVALATGVVLLVVAIRATDWTFIRGNLSRLAPAALAAIAISGAWHVIRTAAWAACFPAGTRLALGRLFRVRLAAEAVSYVTVRGVAGEPLKVVLLRGESDAATATAAVALERLAYIVMTTLLVGVGAVSAFATMPLSTAWSRIFIGFAVGSALICVAVAYLIQRAPRVAVTHRRPAPSSILSNVGHFIALVAADLRVLASGQPRRLAILALAGAASYVLMVLEAWAVLRVSGAPITLIQAFAIETITRVTSFATAFIPANLGALEAASLAATAAAGTPGGATLAMARRLRGLFWSATGFALFPKGRAVRSANGIGRGPGRVDDEPLLYIAEDPSVDLSPSVRVAGLPVAERVLRAARRAGYTRIIAWAPGGLPRSVRMMPGVTIVSSPDHWRALLAQVPGETRLTAIGPGTVVSPQLLADARRVSAAIPEVLDVAAGPGFGMSGVVRVRASLAGNRERLTDHLRDRIWSCAPMPTGDEVSSGHARLALRFRSLSEVSQADATMRRAAFKQTDAKLARFNRRISLPISIALLPTPVTANMMSVFVFVLGMASAWLFSRGEYVAGVLGGALSLAASILDGCDGEIARLKYQESALGCWLETIGDYSYYVAVFVGLTIGGIQQTGWAALGPLGAAGLSGTLLSFALLIFLRRTITLGRPETLHAVARARFTAHASWWSRLVWRVSFVATRAAMPYGIFALALVNLLPVVVVLSAIGANVYWLSLVLKMRQLLGMPAAADAGEGGRLVPSS